MREAEASSLRRLGNNSCRLGEYAQAKNYCEHALRIYREVGDRQGESATLNTLGLVRLFQGHYEEARICYEQALHIARETGSPQHEIHPLVNLGFALGKQGSHVEARIYLEQSLRICRETSDQSGEREVLSELGNVLADLGDYTRAKAYYEQALHICRENGIPEGIDLSRLGLLYHQLGDGETARQYCQQALRIAQNLGSRSGQGYALTFLGHALMDLRQVVEAADAYRQALALRREIGQHHLAIESLAGLASAALAQGDLSQAQIHVKEVLSYLDGHPALHGADEPFRVYMTCYRVLRANEVPGAEEVLDAGYQLLQERANKIDDEDLRRSYLENVPYHRQIVEAWKEASG